MTAKAKPGDLVRYTGGDKRIYESIVAAYWKENKSEVVIGFHIYDVDRLEVLVPAEDYVTRNMALMAELAALRAREKAIQAELKICRESARAVREMITGEEEDDEEL